MTHAPLPARLADYLTASTHVFEAVKALAPAVDDVVAALEQALGLDKAVLVCGNGGSAADAGHIMGELVGRFMKNRRALKCYNLAADAPTLTALGNDYGYEQVFARQVEAFGEEGGVLIAISTSGNSPNVLAAVAEAKKKKMKIIGFTGESGGKLRAMCDYLLAVPSSETPYIQQGHLALYHFICARLETQMFP